MKRRVIERTWPNGTRGFIVQKKTLFGWASLGDFMENDSTIKIYDTMKEAKDAILKSPGKCITKVVYEE